MARYRPPRRRGTPLITPAGEAALRAELARLWKEERPQVTQAVHEAAKNGDEDTSEMMNDLTGEEQTQFMTFAMQAAMTCGMAE